mgnify:CR=1 FL=1
MIVTLLSWGVILWMGSVLGNIFIRKIMPETFQNTTKWDVYCVTGLMILNVYVQILPIPPRKKSRYLNPNRIPRLITTPAATTGFIFNFAFVI